MDGDAGGGGPIVQSLKRDGFAGGGGFVGAVDHLHERQGLVGRVERFFRAFQDADEIHGGAHAAHRFVGGDDDVAVHLAAVFHRVELAGVERGGVDAVGAEEAADEAAGLGALEGDGDFLALVQLGPGNLEREGLAGLEGDETVRGGLDVGHALGDVRDAPRALEGLVVDVVGVGAGEDVGRFGVAHEVHAEVDHVEEIDERAAAGKGLGGEPAAEAGDAGAADPSGLAGVDGADGALLDILHHRVAFGAGAVVEVEHQRLLRLRGGGFEGEGLAGVERGGLFAEDVLAGLQRLEGERGVELVGDDDRDGVELGEGLQHFGDVAEDPGDAVLGGGFFGVGLVDVGEGDDFGAGLAESGGVIGGHAAGTDDGDFDAHEGSRKEEELTTKHTK